MKTKTIIQKIEFKASPHEIYEALMDEKKHAKFTGAKAKISREVGGKFEIYDAGINGKNIELIPDQKIVQDWHCETEGWPEGHYSRLTISLKKSTNGAMLEIIQTGVPEESYDDISSGWAEYYWEPMKKMFEKMPAGKKSK